MGHFGIPVELSKGKAYRAMVFMQLRSYKTEYKFKDSRNKLWILEGIDFFSDYSGISRRTVIRLLKDFQHEGLLKIKSGWHPTRNKKTLMIFLSEKTKKLLGILDKDNSAKTTRLLPRQKCQNDTINSAKTTLSSLYIYNTGYNSLSANADEKGESNVINFPSKHGGRMKKQNEFNSKKGMKVLKTPKSFLDVISELDEKKNDPIVLKNTKPKSVELFWKKLFSRYFPQTHVVSWTGREIGFAKALVSKVESLGLDFAKILEQCFAHWGQFSDYVSKQRGQKSSPDFPSIGFISANSQYLVNFKPEGSVQLIARKKNPNRLTAEDFLSEV